MDSLTVNGKSDVAIIDRAPIHLRWNVSFHQVGFSLKIVSRNTTVYVAEQDSSESCYTIQHIALEKNRKYHVALTVYGSKGQQKQLLTQFNSGNLGQFVAKWISSAPLAMDGDKFYQPQRNIVLKKDLRVSDELDEAYINIVGLGYYNLYINGEKVSDYELNNDWSNYSKIIYYDTFNIRRYLKTGDNEICVELANGWYNPAPLTLFGKYNLRQNLVSGQPKLLAELVLRSEEDEQVVVTDQSWSVGQGSFLFNNIYLGEVVDFRLIKSQDAGVDFHDTQWACALETDGPHGIFVPSFIEKIVQGQRVSPISIESLTPTRHIVDFGTMISGFIDANWLSEEGQEVEFVYSEEINADRSLNTDSTLAGFVGKEVQPGVIVPGGPGSPLRADQRDRCIGRDGEIHFVNRFTYHSFRYVEVSGLTLDQLRRIEAIYACTALAEVGQFESSDEAFNRLYQIAKITKLNNIHSVIEDCARERLAYGGDMVALALSQVMMFDSARLYEKTIYDFIADRMSNGGFPETAPFMGIKTKGTGDGAGPLGWQLAVPYLLKTHYQCYGNIELVKQVYPYLLAQMSHLETLDFNQLNEFCLGDWGSTNANSDDIKSSSPALGFTAACFYYYHLMLLAEFSYILQLESKYKEYQHKAGEIKASIIKLYRNDDGSYADKTQTSYVFALYFDLEQQVDGLVNGLRDLIIENDYVVQCGIFGQSLLYQLANRYELNDLVVRWLQSQQGILHMLQDNNGALKEFFGDNFNGSCNHAMFSSYVAWFYNSLAGINISHDACAADKVVIQPYFAEHIDKIEAAYGSVRGEIRSAWTREQQNIYLQIELPLGVKQGTLILPEQHSDALDSKRIKYSDKKHVHFDISDINRLSVYLNTV